MTLAEMRTRLQNMGYGTDTVASQSDMLQAAYRRLQGLHHWPWLRNKTTLPTVVGTPSYSLAFITDLLHLDAVRLEIGQQPFTLEYKSPEEFAETAHADRDNGIPRFWTERFGEVHLWPRPDRVYTVTIEYTKDPPDILDGSAPIFDATYHDVIVFGALGDIAFRERDWQAGARADAQWDRRVAEMEKAYGVRQTQSSSHVRRSSFWGTVGSS